MAGERRAQVVGTSVPRLDGRDKVTGAARYTGDLQAPGMAYGRLVRSRMPHGRVVSVDPSAALRLPGVFTVLLPEDVRSFGRYGHAVADRPLLAWDKVRYIGDPVAAIAAVDEATAAEAAELVEVVYDELPPVADVDGALAPDAPRLHEGPYPTPEGGGAIEGNICARFVLSVGDAEAALPDAAHVFEDSFTFPSVYQYAMEPHTVLAEADERHIDVWSSAQHPFLVRADLARIFNLPLAAVRVAAPNLGGGYGSKSYTKFEPVAVALARKVGRPVRLEFTVEEAMLTNRRHGAHIWIRTGVDHDGRLLARMAGIRLDTGAYADNGPRVARWACSQLVGPYRLPAYRVEALCVYTSKGPAGSYRGIGQPQGTWAAEGQLDRIAAELGLDPLELRRRNLARRGDRVRPKEKRLDADLPGDLARLAAAAGDGCGFACEIAEAGASPVSVATVRLHADGSLTVLTTSTELGQGARTVLAQVAADELDLPLERVAVVSSDTDATMYDRSTGASRSTTVMGRAVQEACRALARQLVPGWTGDGSQELIGVGYSGPRSGIASVETPVFWETGMGAAEAEADPETGQVRLRRYVSLADIGRAIHPRQCEGQEEGAVLQGIGHTLLEELHWEGGALVNGNLIDYRVPTFEDLPDHLDGVLVENEDGPGPFGCKGIGESGLVPVGPAVAASLRRRYGLRLRELPLTPERVWRAFQARPEAAAGPERARPD